MSDSEDYEFEEASPEEKLRIASHFILSSPNGEVSEVIKDVKTLMGFGSLLDDNVIQKLLRQYNRDLFVFAPLQDGRKVMVTEMNEVNGRYLDTETGILMSFDDVKCIWDEKATEDVGMDTPQAEMRKSLESALKQYAKKFYGDPNTKEYATMVLDMKDGRIIIAISAKGINLSAFWSGGWKSTFELDVSKKGETKVKAKVDLNVHYFEEGNVQLNTSYENELDVSISTLEETAEDLIEVIEDFESTFQKKMEEMYRNMNSQTFKSMRRFLPVTHQKMDWNPQSHRMVGQMTK